MESSVRCPHCGVLLPPGTPVFCCPFCPEAEEDGTGETAAAAGSSGGRVLGGCELFEEIGRGGMGVVWRGRQPGLDREVAVKTLPGGDLAGAEARARFRTEARAAARLKHPNIVTVHEVGESEGMPYFVMELVAGPTLSAVVAGQPVSARRAAGWVRDAALAVAHAHAHGVLHRDLKPSNILLEPTPGGGDGCPKVTDFGLAKLTDADGGMTLTGSAAGSPSFMPPEQARGGGGSVAGDVYGLGAVLYHALTGRPPFHGESVAAVLAQVERDEPLAPRALTRSVPRDLETVCLKCLEKDPGRRYAGAAELAEDLSRFLEGRPVRARPLGRTVRLLRLARRRPWQSAAAGLALALTACALFLLTWKTSSDRRYQAALREEQAATRLALMRSRLGEARALVRLRLPDSRPRALAVAESLAGGDLPDPVRAEARDLALAALALPAARVEALAGEGADSEDWTLAAADWPRKRWALASFDGFVRLRPLDPGGTSPGIPPPTIRTGGRRITALIRFSPGGRWLAVRHGEELAIWDTGGGEAGGGGGGADRESGGQTPPADRPAGKADAPVFSARPWVSAPFGFMTVSFSPDDRAVAWVDGGSVVVTELPGGRELSRWRTPGPVRGAGGDENGDGDGDGAGPLRADAVAFDPGGGCLAFAHAGSEPQVEIRSWPGGNVLRRITGLPGAACALALTGKGERVAAGDAEGHVTVWHQAEGLSRRLDLPGHAGPLRALAFDSEGRRLFSSSDDGTLHIQDCAAGRRVARVPFDLGIPALSPDGLRAGAGYAEGSLSTVRLEPPAILHLLRPPDPPQGFQRFSFHADSGSLHCLTGAGAARCAVPDGRTLESTAFTKASTVLASENGGLWIGGPEGLFFRRGTEGADGSAAAPAPLIRVFPAARWGWDSLCGTPDGRRVAAADNAGGRAVVLDPRRPDPSAARILTVPGQGPGALALSPDGSRLAVGFRYEPGLLLLDTRTEGEPPRKLELPARHSLAWSPDGLWLAACGSSAACWETGSWQRVSLADSGPGHPPNGGVAFAPAEGSGRSRLLAMTEDNTRIVLFSLPEGQRLATLEAPEGRPVGQLGFSPSARWLAAATAGGEIQLWDLPAVLKAAAGFQRGGN